MLFIIQQIDPQNPNSVMRTFSDFAQIEAADQYHAMDLFCEAMDWKGAYWDGPYKSVPGYGYMRAVPADWNGRFNPC